MTGNRKRTITCHVARAPRCQTLKLLGCVFDKHLEILADVIHGAVQTLHLPVPPPRPFQGHSHLLCRDAVEGPECSFQAVKIFLEVSKVFHGDSLSVLSRLCGCAAKCCSLNNTRRDLISLGIQKRNKNSSCIRLPVKVHFRTRICSTHQRKLLSFIPHLRKKVNRMHKKTASNETIPK